MRMHLTTGDVLEQLVAEGLAPADAVGRARAALAGASDDSPPWFARVIAGFGAWVATGFLIGFLVVTKIVNEEIEAIIVGAVLVAAAVYIRRRAAAEEEFKRQLAFAGSLTGQVLVIAGVVGETRSAAIAGVVTLAMSVVLVTLVPDPAHRFMSGLIGSIAALAAMADLRLAWTLGDLGPAGPFVVRGTDFAALAIVALLAYVWRIDLRTRSVEAGQLLEPVGYGATVGLLAVLLFSSLFGVADDLMRGPQSTRVNAWHLGPVTTIGITVALIALITRILAEQRRLIKLTAATPLLLGLLTLSTPGIMAALALLVLGFDRRNRILIWLAVAFLVKFASVYYYSLQMTLLEKSMVLAASGLLLLAARAYVELRYKPGGADA